MKLIYRTIYYPLKVKEGDIVIKLHLNLLDILQILIGNQNKLKE